MNEIDDSIADPTILPMICMVDKKSRVYPAPVTYNSVELYKRELLHAAKYGKDVNGRPPFFAEYPQDFELVLVGKFDSRTGTILPEHQKICDVADVLLDLPKPVKE